MPLRIVDRSKAPQWSKEDYPYIQRGFIAPYYKNMTDAVETLWNVNNETTNVWTQLIGWIVFYGAFLIMLFTPPKDRSADGWHYHFCMQACLFSNIIVCSFSLWCHMWQARNKRWHTILSAMDWGGTAVVGIVTCAVMDWNAEYKRHGDLSDLHWYEGRYHFASVVVGFIVLVCLFVFGNTNHAFRFYSIFVVALFAAVPMIPTFAAAHNPTRLITSLGGFLVGGTLFATHLPEKSFPRTFDLCCSSHTLWHCGYLVGLYQAMACLALAYTGHVPWETSFVELTTWLWLG